MRNIQSRKKRKLFFYDNLTKKKDIQWHTLLCCLLGNVTNITDPLTPCVNLTQYIPEEITITKTKVYAEDNIVFHSP